MEEKKVYNGVIDWWKIVFCLIIVVMHVGEYYHGDSFIFIWGRYGVEFFFIVSGFFMAAHVMRMDESVGLKNIGKENVLFTWSKIKTILPAYLTAWVLALVMYIKKVGVVIYEQEGLRQFAVRMVHAIPNLLLLDMSGIKNSGVLGISWYVSAMLLVMFITYPALRKWRRNYCYIAAPIIAIALAGYFSVTYDGKSGRDLWMGFMKYGMFRAFISINLGCVSYLIAEKLKESFQSMSTFKKVIIRIAEPVLYIACIILMHYGDCLCINEINIMFMLAIGITMSGNSAFAGICNNNICRTLGKLSLWIYFLSSPVRMFVRQTWPDISYSKAFMLIFFPSIIISVIAYSIYSAIHKRKKLKVNTI